MQQHVIAFPFKELMRLDVNHYVKVALGSSQPAGLAFIAEPQPGPGIHAGWNADRHLFLDLDPPPA